MKKQIGKRLGCAALATQMLLAPVAQAADPLREWLASSAPGSLISRSETRLNGGEERQDYPHLDLSSGGTMSSSAAPTPAPSETPPAEVTVVPAATPTPAPSETPPAETTEPSVSPTPAPSETPPVETTEPSVSPTPAPSETPPAETTEPSVSPIPTPSETPPMETTEPSVSPTPAPSETPPGETTEPSVSPTPAPSETPPVETTEPSVSPTPAPSESPPAETTLLPSGTPEPTSSPNRRPLKAPGVPKSTEPDYGDRMAPILKILAFYGFGGHGIMEYNNKSDAVKDKYLLEKNDWYADQYYNKSEDCYYDDTLIYDPIAEMGLASLYGKGFSIYNPGSGWEWQKETGGSIYWEPSDGKTYFRGDRLPTAEDLPRLPNREFTDEWYVYDSKPREVEMTPGDKYQIIPGGPYQRVFLDESGSPYFAHYNADTSSYTTSYGDVFFQTRYESLQFEEGRDEVLFDPGKPLEEYLKYVDEAAYLPLVGKWIPSTNATATSFALKTTGENGEEQKLYPVGDVTADQYAAMTANELKAAATTDFDPKVGTYFLRVPYDVKELAFDLEAYEPGSKVELKVTHGKDIILSRDDASLLYKEEWEKDEKGYPANSEDAPVRGKWSLKTGDVIPLEPAASGKDEKYNVVTFTVTAPNGTTTKDYTVYVQRLTVPRLIQNAGNTPYGMIDRDDALDADGKKTLREYFSDKKKFDPLTAKNRKTPIGNNNNNGYFNDLTQSEGGHYSLQAWGNAQDKTFRNLDLDPKAIVAYQNMPFRIPGFQIYDALGNYNIWATGTDKESVDSPSGNSPDDVKWTLTLTTVANLSPDIFTNGDTGNEVTFSGAGTDGWVDLTGYNVKPGVYTIHYTYRDHYDSTSDSSKPAHDEKETSVSLPEELKNDVDKIGYAKQVVILPLRGDVDMDGAVTAADGVLLQRLLDEKFFASLIPYPASGADPALCLYYYRVCDVYPAETGVNANDVNALLSGYKAAVPPTIGANLLYRNYYYLPLVDQTWQETPVNDATDPSKATISLEYLGKKTDGKLDPGAKVDYIPGSLDTFWVGVKLADAKKLGDLGSALTSLTLTLTYDSSYVTPYVEKGKTWGDVILGQNPDWKGWTLADASVDLVPTTHSSKAETELKGAAESKDTLRELRLTLTPGTGNVQGKALTNGTLFQIPFQLKKYPVTREGEQSGTKVADLIELTLGMRDLAVTTKDASAVWNNDEAWITGSEQKLTSSVTTNLTRYFNYGGSASIPMGEDRTPVYRVYLDPTTVGGKEKQNPVYGEAFVSGSSAYPPTGEAASIAGSVNATIRWLGDYPDGPGGLKYTPGANNPLTGTPERAGTFAFRIVDQYGNVDPTPFQLEVDKAPLDLTVQDVTKYYGEDNDHTTEKTFTYDVTQIKALDYAAFGGAAAPTDKSAEFLSKHLSGYTAPTFTLAEKIDSAGKVTEATAATVPGDYTILIQGGGSANYQFRYKTKDGETDTKTGSADYTILPRPLLVQKVGKVENGKEEPLLELWSFDDGSMRRDQNTLYSQKGFTAAQVTTAKNKDGKDAFPDGTLKLAPLTPTITVLETDDLELTYDVWVTPSEGDTTSEFILKKDTEPRSAVVRNLRLASGKKNNDYYDLVQRVPEGWESDGFYDPEHGRVNCPVDKNAVARIKQVVITKILVQSDSSYKEYYYGGTLNVNGLVLRYETSVDKSDGNQAKNAISDFEKPALGCAAGMSVYWVDSDTAIPTASTPRAKDSEILEVKKHDGKYLCITGGSAAPVYVGPFTVHKNTLNLTVRGERDEKLERYYGETDPSMILTYDVNDLTEWDREALKKANGNKPLTGAIGELVSLAGYKAPTTTPRKAGDLTAEKVTAETDVGNYYLLIDGAVSDNYQFTYTRVSHSGETTVDAKFGYTPLIVYKRPILVTRITAKAGALFHNTTRRYLDPAQAVYSDSTRDFDVRLPGRDTPGVPGTSYYSDSRGRPYDVLRLPLDRDGDPVRQGDNLNLAYRAQFAVDDENGPPFYKLGEEETFRTVTVDVSDLRLAEGGKGGNYELIFRSGKTGVPEQDTQTTGEVWKRKILGVTVVAEPNKTVYTYGEILDLSGLKVRVRYEHDETGILPDETVVPYSYTSSSLGPSNTFAQIGLSLCWDDEGRTPAEDRQPLSVGEHSGRRLIVLAPQYPGTETRGQDTVKTALRVGKKVLTLQVEDRTRKYGDTIPDYGFTFDPEQLSTWDREALGSIPATGIATALNTAATSAALAAVNEPYKSYEEYVGPRFETDVKENTPVRQAAYPLRLVGGSMANYRFEMEKGGITIEKRPIYIVGINSTSDKPIYTIFAGTSLRDFETICYQGPDALTDAEGNLIDGADLTLAAELSGNNALVGDDSIALRVKVSFPDSNISGSGAEESKSVTVTPLELTRGSENYELSRVDPVPAIGRVTKREIESFRIYRQPTKMDYIYGEAMDLAGMYIWITYGKMAGEASSKEEIVSPTAMDGIYVNYWDPDEAMPAVTDLENIIVERSQRTEPAAAGDHLTRALNDSGFSHNGKKLLVSARVDESKPFQVDAVLSDKLVTVAPRELTYTLEAQNKPYNGNTQARGTLTLTNVYVDDEGNGDRIWIENGTDYTVGSLPENYAFESGDYNDGLTFTFVDPNVSYAETGHDSYLDMQPIPVEVTNIALAGRDKDNYAINSAVTQATEQMEGRDGVPYAVISPKERDLPTGKVELWVDEHTNTVTVLPAQDCMSFGDEADAHNSELHYEYALLYIEDGEVITTPFQDSPYFGGEKVEVEGDSGVGGGQSPVTGDTDFGLREPLPRGTHVGALVRLAQTNNYDASVAAASFGGTADDDPQDLKTAFLTMVETQGDRRPPAPDKEEKDRWAERLPGPVIRTYTYRIDLISVQEERRSAEETVRLPALEAVWFTDVAKYEKEENMSRVLDNLETVRYYNYSWDAGQSVKVQFPLALDEQLLVELPSSPDGKGDKILTLVNPDGTLHFYVSTKPTGGGNGIALPTAVWVEPKELTLWEDDDPVQLEATVSQSGSYDPRLRWESSDESVVTVDENGLVTVVGPGEARITVTLLSYGIKDTVEVKVLKREKTALPLPFAGTMFNTGYLGAFMPLVGGRFEPDRVVTRRELTVILERFLRILEGLEPAPAHSYIDVAEDVDYASAVRSMDQWGIVRGVGEDLFAPERPATRAEIAAILNRMLCLPTETDPNVPHAFLDGGPEDTWAWADINALAKAGVTKGTGEGYYNPKRILTRAELATMLGRILVTRVDMKAETLLVPSDVGPDHWAYENILRAVNSDPAVGLLEEYVTGIPEKSEEEKK